MTEKKEVTRVGDKDYFPVSSTHVGRDTIVVDLDQIATFEKLETRYDRDGFIASGAQGEISIAIDRNLQRYIAVKSLHADLLDNDALVSSFIAEAKITAQLDHPSIIPLYDIMGDAQKGVHISMKLVEGGGTFQQLLNKRIFSCKSGRATKQDENRLLREHIGYFIKVCEAVAYAHSQGVVHCDLKPENIMVGSFQDVYVMDWGLARVVDATQEAEKNDDSMAGTPRYISPEILKGAYTSPANDLYALAMILYEIVTLTWANEGRDQDEIYSNTMRGNLKPIKHRFSSYKIHADLKAIIRKAAAVCPENRYANVNELAGDLRCFERDEEVLARPDTLARGFGRRVYKHRIVATALLLIVFSALTTFASLTLLQKERMASRAKTTELRHLNFQTELESKAHTIDTALMQLGFILEKLSYKMLDGGNRNTVESFYRTTKFPILRMYAAFEDGSIFRYPNRTDIAYDFNPLVRPWYTASKINEGTVWIKPYYDIIGTQKVLTGALRMRSKEGVFAGVVALDLSLKNALRMIESKNEFVRGRYLLNSVGEIVLETHPTSTEKHLFFTTDEFKHFIQGKKSGQFQLGPHLLAFASIESLGLYLMEEIVD